MARPTAQTLRWIKSLVKRGDAKVEAFAHYANQEVLITGNATQEPLVDVGATESERKKAIHVWSRGFTRCLQTPRNSIAVLNHANRPLSTYSITCQTVGTKPCDRERKRKLSGKTWTITVDPDVLPAADLKRLRNFGRVLSVLP